MVRNLLWKTAALVISRKPIADFIIKMAMKTPYFHLPGYMNRFWVFNPYGGKKDDKDADEFIRHEAKYSWLPSIRIHHILREDLADDMHDHPWDARTIILKGWYMEERLEDVAKYSDDGYGCGGDDVYYEKDVVSHLRQKGDTASIKFQEYHNIKKVSDGGVWTLFITWKYRGGWGFLVDGVKIPWQDYSEKRTD